MSQPRDGLSIRQFFLSAFLPISIFAISCTCFLFPQLYLIASSTPYPNQPISPSPENNLPSKNISQNLELGKRIEGTLASEQCQSFQFQLSAGDFGHLVVHQRGLGMNIRVDLYDPRGKQLYSIGGFSPGESVLPIAVVAETSRTYRMKVCAHKNKAPGFYWVEMDERRTATAEDADSGQAKRLWEEGWALEHQDNAELFPQVVKNFEESLQLWRVIGDRYREGLLLHDLGSVYHSRGEYQKALGCFFQALPFFRAIGSLHMEADTLTSIGETYSFLSEYQNALAYFEQALPVIHTTDYLIQGKWEILGWVLSDIAAVHSAMGEKEKALDFAFQSLRAYQESGNHTTEPRGQAIANTSIGKIYAAIGEKQKALDYFEVALPYWRAEKDRSGEAQALHQIGEVYASLGDHQRALDYYNQALSLWHGSGDRYGEALALHSLGALYTSLNEYEIAVEDLQHALELRRDMGEQRGEAYTLTSLGLVYQRSSDYQKALNYYKDALELWRGIGDRYGEAYALTYLGEVFLAQGDSQRALDFFKQALPIRRAVMDKEGEANTLYDIARLDHLQGDFRAASDNMIQVLDIAESVRANVALQEERAAYLASIHDYYEFYIDVLMRLDQANPSGGYNTKAFQVSERAHARSLLDILAQAQGGIRLAADPQLVEQEHGLQTRLQAKIQQQIQSAKNQPAVEQVEALGKEIEGMRKEYQIVQERIKASRSSYAELMQPQLLSPAEIQKNLLDADTLLLEYALGDERSFLWVVSPESITSFELPKRAVIEAASRRVYDLLVARNRREKGESIARQAKRLELAEAEFPTASSLLTKMVLAPAAHLLGVKRLLIVADGALQYIPFAALPEPTASTGGSDDFVGRSSQSWTPLVSSHEIVNLPSASTLGILRRELGARKPSTKTLAVIADPVFDQDDPRVLRHREGETGTTRNGGGAISEASSAASLFRSEIERSAFESGVTDETMHIPRLPFARREAEAILIHVPSEQRKAALDFQANLATAMNPDLGQFRIVHFATHGLLNSAHPQLSGLVLSLVNPQGRSQDGFLRLSQIYNLKLPADLVVLSACQTGLGREIKGEGLIGLTRGFMYAGAARVMASLWKVDDRATAELMAKFYEAMLGDQHLRPADALRQAQLFMWKEKRWASPYYWAAFTLQGEWR